MSTFSGTNLPPIVRLGGTSDALINLDRGTLYDVAPEHIRQATAVRPAAVVLPTKTIRAENPIETDSPPAKPARQQQRRRKRRPKPK